MTQTGRREDPDSPRCRCWPPPRRRSRRCEPQPTPEAAGARLALATPAAGLAAGLAWAVDADAGRVAFVPGELLDRPRGHATRWPGSSAPPVAGCAGEARRSRPLAIHDGKALMGPLLDRGVEMRDPLIDTMLAAYLLDPADARYDLSDVAGRYAGLDPPAHAPPEGRLDLDGDAVEPAEQAGWAVLAIDRLVTPLREALAAQGLDRLNDEVEVPLVRVLARMEHIGIGVDRSVLETDPRRARHRGRGAAARRAGRRRARHQRQLAQAARRGAVRRPRAHAHQADQDRVLHRRAVAGEAAGRAPHRRPPARLPRGGEAAIHLRGRAAGRGRSGRAHPGHLQPDRGPHRPAQLRRAQPPQHPGALRAGAGVPHRLRGTRRAASCWSPTTTRSSCAASPIWPRTRA